MRIIINESQMYNAAKTLFDIIFEDSFDISKIINSSDKLTLYSPSIGTTLLYWGVTGFHIGISTEISKYMIDFLKIADPLTFFEFFGKWLYETYGIPNGQNAYFDDYQLKTRTIAYLNLIENEGNIE